MIKDSSERYFCISDLIFSFLHYKSGSKMKDNNRGGEGGVEVYQDFCLVWEDTQIDHLFCSRTFVNNLKATPRKKENVYSFQLQA